MNIVTLRTASQQAEGVRGKTPLGEDDFYVFADVSPGTTFTMQGVNHDINIAFFDKSGILLNETGMVRQATYGATAPPDTAFAVEYAPNVAMDNVKAAFIFLEWRMYR